MDRSISRFGLTALLRSTLWWGISFVKKSLASSSMWKDLYCMPLKRALCWCLITFSKSVTNCWSPWEHCVPDTKLTTTKRQFMPRVGSRSLVYVLSKAGRNQNHCKTAQLSSLTFTKPSKQFKTSSLSISSKTKPTRSSFTMHWAKCSI